MGPPAIGRLFSCEDGRFLYEEEEGYFAKLCPFVVTPFSKNNCYIKGNNGIMILGMVII